MTTLSTLNGNATQRAGFRHLTNTRLGRYITAYLEMTVSMIVGMQVLGVVWDAVWPGLTARPDVMALTMAFDMAVGMAAWMWVRRHTARHIAEMSAVMVLPFLVLLVPYWLGVLSGDGLLTCGHAAMFVLMGVYLALRPHSAHAISSQDLSTEAISTQRSNAYGRAPRPALTASTLLVTGGALALIAGTLHPHEEPPNSHTAVFTEYAQSSDWMWIHDLQFLSAAIVVAGFLMLGRALHRAGNNAAIVNIGYAAAAGTVALIAVNMAVDGVALKRAVDAWADARPEDQASRFAAAEAVRWLEWGVNSFFTILLGITMLMFAAALLRQAQSGTRIRLAAVSGTLAGILLIVSGLAVGAHGFEPSDLPLVANVLYVVMALGVTSLDKLARPEAPPAACSSPMLAREPLASEG